MHKSIVLFLSLLSTGMMFAPDIFAAFAENLKGGKTAVVVYAQNPAARHFQKNALSRLESILLDNAIDVLDREKAEALKNVFNTLEDPGAFVTAETFVENSRKFAIQGLVAVFLSVGVTRGLAAYFSATAQADVRYIQQDDARVATLATLPMGAPGRPPSDGLTRNSAAVNAVQRAIDDACTELGMEIMDPATPRSVQLRLEGPLDPPPSLSLMEGAAGNDAIAGHAVLEKERWRAEKVTCTTVAQAGSLGAVAGYIVDTDFRRRPQRLYGSRMHLIDLESKQELMVFNCHAVEKSARDEKGTKQILDCMFVLNWRYLSAVTGNRLFLWDTERGLLQASILLPAPVKKAALHLAHDQDTHYLVVQSGRGQAAYAIARK